MIRNFLYITFLSLSLSLNAQTKESETIQAEHNVINVNVNAAGVNHTKHPGAQWYPDAGLGLFIHWGLSSVKDLDASWPMVVGWGIQSKKLDSAEIERIVREKDYQKINEGRPYVTPAEYWSMAREFNPQNYDPDKWIKAARDAGFAYVVLTTKHHEGFALWPSKYGNFNTRNYMGGKDLLKPYVEACRKYGLKVGFYFSPPDWYFDKDYRNFLLGGAGKTNPSFPELDEDLKPRNVKPSAEQIKKHRAEYASLIRGQVTELLTRYGKIDLLWFDGKPAVEDPSNVITQEEIRKLQPGIVINPRLHGTGDFKTYERTPPRQDPGDIWAEFCNPWTSSWANSNTLPFRSNAFMIGQFVTMRSWGVNYLPSVGPKADGSMPDAVYQNMNVIGGWMKINGRAVKGVMQLPASEWSSVPATARSNTRYLFIIPEFKDGGMYEKDRMPARDTVLLLKGISPPKAVRLLGVNKKLEFTYAEHQLSVQLPARLRTDLVDVVQVEL